MSNKYGISIEDEKRIRTRDKTCVYCHKEMMSSNGGGWCGDWATIEHLNYLPPWNNPATVAMCCWSCNSSRSNKKLTDWFKSSYCMDKNINTETVAKPVKDYIKSILSLVDTP